MHSIRTKNPWLTHHRSAHQRICRPWQRSFEEKEEREERLKGKSSLRCRKIDRLLFFHFSLHFSLQVKRRLNAIVVVTVDVDVVVIVVIVVVVVVVVVAPSTSLKRRFAKKASFVMQRRFLPFFKINFSSSNKFFFSMPHQTASSCTKCTKVIKRDIQLYFCFGNAWFVVMRI